MALLADAKHYYGEFMRAAQRAAHSIIVIAWDFDSRTRLAADDAPGGRPVAIGEFLNSLVKKRRGLNVYVLNWDYPTVFGPGYETRPLYGLGWTPRHRVHLHYDNTLPAGASHHQSIVVIDDALAFCGGRDLTCRRWDGRSPEVDTSGTTGSESEPTFLSPMVAVDGDAAQVLARMARSRWLLATGETIPPAQRASDPWPLTLEPDMTDVDVAVSRTGIVDDVREVETLYVDMIAAAKDSIYIENPYITSHRIGAALAARLAAPHPPEVVLITPLRSHDWLEEHTTRVLRARLLKQCRDADTHHRFEAYYPYMPGVEAERAACDAKVMVVDDEWVRIGSAHLTNRSMALDSECDVTIAARGTVEGHAAVRSFRDRLLARHLGREVREVRTAVERSGSLHAVLRELQREGRTLRVLEAVPENAEALVDAVSSTAPEPLVSLERLIDEFAPDTDAHPHGPAWGKIAAIALLIAGLAALWRHTPLSDLVTAERIIAWSQGVGDIWWAPLVVMLAYTPACIVMFPRPLITLFAVIAFGPVRGLIYSLLGILGAALATYFIGRASPRDIVRRLAGDKLNEMTDVLRRRGLLAVFAVRIVPVAPFAIEGMVAGAVRIRLWHYALGTVLGMLPGTLTTTIFGEQIQTALADPSQINYWLVGGVALFFVVLSLAVRRWFVEQHRASRLSSPEPA